MESLESVLRSEIESDERMCWIERTEILGAVFSINRLDIPDIGYTESARPDDIFSKAK